MAETKSNMDVSEEQTAGNAADQIGQLRETIREHQYRYYILDAPAVSDLEFDALFQKLLELEAEHPELRSADSPTVRVGGDVSERFERTRHPAPMLSLQNAFSMEDLYAWRERLKRFLPAERHGELSYVVEPKFDGLTVVLRYDHGDFVLGATRGDGGPMTRLQLSVGRTDGVRPGDIVGAIANEADIPGRSIGHIELMDRSSFVDVPEHLADRVLRALRNTTIRGRAAAPRMATGRR